MKKQSLKKKEEGLDKEMENIEYGVKELIQGIVIGIVLGFALAWFLLK